MEPSMSEQNPPSVRAAQYVRMSTDQQSFSIGFQKAAIEDYARDNGQVVVRTYEDAGISGLDLANRPALRRLLADILSGDIDFQVILTYDISRWGRFQDPDQAAHYEFICRNAGVPVEYCAEKFTNDGSPMSGVIKALRRIMAAEYSRDLSDKVTLAQRRLALQGFWQGGPAGYGFRRAALRSSGHRTQLETGEFHGVQGEPTIIVHGPREEVALVRWIFHSFNRGLSQKEIARRINASNIPRPSNGQWNGDSIRRILSHEKYTGTLVIGRERCRLGKRSTAPEREWVKLPNFVEPIVSRRTFAAAQARLGTRKSAGSDKEMLSVLRAVLADHGRLSIKIISDDPRAHSPSAYARRFGSMEAAYRLVGYAMSAHQQTVIEQNKRLRPYLKANSARRTTPKGASGVDLKPPAG